MLGLQSIRSISAKMRPQGLGRLFSNNTLFKKESSLRDSYHTKETHKVTITHPDLRRGDEVQLGLGGAHYLAPKPKPNNSTAPAESNAAVMQYAAKSESRPYPHIRLRQSALQPLSAFEDLYRVGFRRSMFAPDRTSVALFHHLAHVPTAADSGTAGALSRLEGKPINPLPITENAPRTGFDETRDKSTRRHAFDEESREAVLKELGIKLPPTAATTHTSTKHTRHVSSDSMIPTCRESGDSNQFPTALSPAPVKKSTATQNELSVSPIDRKTLNRVAIDLTGKPLLPQVEAEAPRKRGLSAKARDSMLPPSKKAKRSSN